MDNRILKQQRRRFFLTAAKKRKILLNNRNYLEKENKKIKYFSCKYKYLLNTVGGDFRD